MQDGPQNKKIRGLPPRIFLFDLIYPTLLLELLLLPPPLLLLLLELVVGDECKTIGYVKADCYGDVSQEIS